MPRWLYVLIQLTRRLWVRTALFTLLALAAAAAAWLFEPWVPDSIGELLGGEAVERLLSILASSMLVITTFSLGTMVSAFQAAAGLATPRVAPLMVEGSVALHAISTFVGTFVFSVTGIVAIDSGLIGTGGRALMFIFSFAILSVVVITLIRWVDDVSRLGQIHDTLRTIELSTREALDSDPLSRPGLGHAYTSLPEGHDVYANGVGFVQTIDFKAIDEARAGLDLEIYLTAWPGSFCHRHRQLCRIVPPAMPDPRGDTDVKSILDDALQRVASAISAAFVIGPRRTLLQDPRYGFTLMGEVAAKALSPGVNDPGTAIDAIVSATRTLDFWQRECTARDPQTQYDWLYANPLAFDDLAPEFFETLIRHGANDASVMLRLYKSLEAIAQLAPQGRATIERLAVLSHARCQAAQLIDDERLRLTRANAALIEHLRVRV
ncbi:MAG: DUF2254 family protein [Burkholderiaceae bacterium]